jgi:hypothetical protein
MKGSFDPEVFIVADGIFFNLSLISDQNNVIDWK